MSELVFYISLAVDNYFSTSYFVMKHVIGYMMLLFSISQNFLYVLAFFSFHLVSLYNLF